MARHHATSTVHDPADLPSKPTNPPALKELEVREIKRGIIATYPRDSKVSVSPLHPPIYSPEFCAPFRATERLPTGSARRNRRKKKGGYRLGEPMLYSINLAKDTAEIIEAPVSRTFGLIDMYRDFSNASNQHYLEGQLAKLESRAGVVVSKTLKHSMQGTRKWRSPVRNETYCLNPSPS
jgi:hypothetical protein